MYEKKLGQGFPFFSYQAEQSSPSPHLAESNHFNLGPNETSFSLRKHARAPSLKTPPPTPIQGKARTPGFLLRAPFVYPKPIRNRTPSPPFCPHPRRPSSSPFSSRSRETSVASQSSPSAKRSLLCCLTKGTHEARSSFSPANRTQFSKKKRGGPTILTSTTRPISPH